MSLIKLYKYNECYYRLILVLITILTLSACGLSGEKGGTSGRASSNSNVPDNSGGLDNDTFEIKQKIGIRVERINGDINQVSTTQISIVSLSEAFRESSSSTPDYRVERRQIGGYEIQLASKYIEKVNQVVKVVFNNRITPKEILYAPLYSLASETETITVNAKSHYVLKKLFDSIQTSSELAQLLPCTGLVTVCPHQSLAKMTILKEINTAAAEYNVSIPTSSTVSEALSFLDQRFDLKRHVESAVNEITRTESPFAKATRRSFDPLSAAPPTSQYYHSIYFGLSFSDLTPNDTNRSVNISSSSSVIADVIINEGEDDEEIVKAYPGFNQSTTMLDMRKDILSSDIPFIRTSLEIAQNDNITLLDNQDLNGLTSTGNTDSHLSTQGFLLNERVLAQTVPNESAVTTPVGWEFNPFFTRSYQTNEYEPISDLADKDEVPDYGSAPTWLTSSNYSKAASFSLSGTKNSYTRETELEDMHLFSWEVYGLETNKDPGFTLSPMNGKEYGAISYSLKLNDAENTNTIQLIAETARWNISSGTNSGTISITQPTNHYKTFSLSRDSNNTTLGVRPENNLLTSPRGISRLATIDSSGSSYQGLISFGGQGTGQPQGHATANGSYMALVFNTKQKADPFDRGQGIILASELITSFDYLFSGEIYQLQGNTMELTNDKNIIHQLNGSTIEIEPAVNIQNNQCIANLSVKRTSVEHAIGSQDNTLSNPIESTQENIFSQSCTVNNSEIRIEFTNLVFGEPLILSGFITQTNDGTSNVPGNLINLIWQQNNQLGLVFANKEQDLSPTFTE
tara:strand:+ start:107 stop:2506 length:2400 start_codon:yes stop_codon:yes gene_type:complete